MADFYDELAAEIANDPMALGYQPYVDVGADADVARLINTLHSEWSVTVVVPVRTALKWGTISHGAKAGSPPQTGSGPLAAIYDEAQTGNSSARSACIALMQLFATPSVMDLILADPTTQDMLNQIVAAGIITQADMDALNAQAVRAGATRAEVLWGVGFAVTHLQVARSQGRGTGV